MPPETLGLKAKVEAAVSKSSQSDITEQVEESIGDAEASDIDTGSLEEIPIQARVSDDSQDDISDQVSQAASDVQADIDTGSIDQPPAITGRGGGSAGGAAMGAATGAGLGGAAKMLGTVALGGIVATGMFKAMEDASGRLSAVTSTFGQATKLFFKPFGDAIARGLLDESKGLLGMAVEFNRLANEKGLDVAVTSIAKQAARSLGIGDVTGSKTVQAEDVLAVTGVLSLSASTLLTIGSKIVASTGSLLSMSGVLALSAPAVLAVTGVLTLTAAGVLEVNGRYQSPATKLFSITGVLSIGAAAVLAITGVISLPAAAVITVVGALTIGAAEVLNIVDDAHGEPSRPSGSVGGGTVPSEPVDLPDNIKTPQNPTAPGGTGSGGDGGGSISPSQPSNPGMEPPSGISMNNVRAYIQSQTSLNQTGNEIAADIPGLQWNGQTLVPTEAFYDDIQEWKGESGMQEGGVVTSRTRAVVGEKGRNEAVIPLDQFRRDLRRAIEDAMPDDQSDEMVVRELRRLRQSVQNLGAPKLDRDTTRYEEVRR